MAEAAGVARFSALAGTRVARSLFITCAVAFASACTVVQASQPARHSSGAELSATAWPEADGLFRQSRRWLGGDAASTIPLGGGKTLWLFGDSFVAHQTEGDRTKARMIHSSVAIQTGLDPATARLFQYWGAEGAEPAAFLPWKVPGEWLWPLHGVRVGDTLTIFCVRVRSGGGPLGFALSGWVALRAIGVDVSPAAWDLRPLPVPAFPDPVFAGVSVVHTGGWVFAYANHANEPRDAFLMRWPEPVFIAGDLSQPEWWVGDRWVPQHALAGWPTPVLRGAPSEFSVSAHPTFGFVLVQSLGFPAGDLAVRFADRLEGPWTEPSVVFRPPEAQGKSAFVYAGKAHPELSGGDLVATYVASSLDFAEIMGDPSRYYPRFVRLQVR